MIGGGFGDSILAMVHEQAVGEVVSEMERHFGERGSGRMKAFVVQPTGGATCHDVA